MKVGAGVSTGFRRLVPASGLNFLNWDLTSSGSSGTARPALMHSSAARTQKPPPTLMMPTRLPLGGFR